VRQYYQHKQYVAAVLIDKIAVRLLQSLATTRKLLTPQTNNPVVADQQKTRTSPPRDVNIRANPIKSVRASLWGFAFE